MASSDPASGSPPQGSGENKQPPAPRGQPRRAMTPQEIAAAQAKAGGSAPPAPAPPPQKPPVPPQAPKPSEYKAPPASPPTPPPPIPQKAPPAPTPAAPPIATPRPAPPPIQAAPLKPAIPIIPAATPRPVTPPKPPPAPPSPVQSVPPQAPVSEPVAPVTPAAPVAPPKPPVSPQPEIKPPLAATQLPKPAPAVAAPAPRETTTPVVAPIPAPVPLEGREKIIWRVAVGLLYAFTLTLYVPWTPDIPIVELDTSWYMILHWAFLNGADFGHDIVFTYGPLGFLFQGYHPSTFYYSVATWVLIATGCFLAVLQIVQRLSPKRWIQGLWIFGFMALVGTSIRGMHDIRLFVTCWSLLLLHFFIDRRSLSGLKIALVIALAVMSLGKFSLALVACMVVVLISIEQLSRKAVPGLSYIYLGAMALLWLLAGQNPFSVLLYLRQSFQIAAGYAAGEGLDSPNEFRDVFLYIVVALGFLAVVGSIHGREVLEAWKRAGKWKDQVFLETGLRAILLLGALAAALFLCFKIGYVRHDEHELLATTCITALAMMYLAVLRPTATHSPLRKALVALPLVCFALVLFSFYVWVPWGLPGQLTETVVKFPGRTFSALGALVGTDSNRREYASKLEHIRGIRPVPQAKGTVDAMSWIQRAVFANGMELRPRPVIQGYLCYTPELARLNADFLRGSRAPDSVLLDVQSIDNCYPSLAEAASWPELLGRYELKDAYKGAILLERAKRPRQYSRTLLQTTRGTLGKWIPVPASTEPIWAQIKLPTTLGGRVMQTLYKPPEVHLSVRTADKQIAYTKLIPGIASEGFLLSPLTADRMEFSLLWANQWRELLKNRIVTEMQVTVGDSGDSSYTYASEFELTFEELRFEHMDIAAVPGIMEYLRFQYVLQSVKTPDDSQVLVAKNDDWQAVLFAPAPKQYLMDVPRNVAGMRFSFGLLKDAYTTAPGTQGVEFRVYAATILENGQIQATPLWGHKLDPLRSLIDRNMQVGEIAFPAEVPAKVLLETAGTPQDAANWGYWTNVSFRAR